MKWTEPNDPDAKVSYYTHVISETPLGRCKIEWKGWKENDSYSITIGDEYVGDENDLDDAKELAKDWLTMKHGELSTFLGI